ncbi:hypothetical protein Q5530_16200 [Saccharothrix sp. BKS2]|uniref:hypothetical protein n=1 Tax=Saccharothrix sp. BKS2 TaxID=3064400 RepID=UPI0039EC9D90
MTGLPGFGLVFSGFLPLPPAAEVAVFYGPPLLLALVALGVPAHLARRRPGHPLT